MVFWVVGAVLEWLPRMKLNPGESTFLPLPPPLLAAVQAGAHLTVLNGPVVEVARDRYARLVEFRLDGIEAASMVITFGPDPEPWPIRLWRKVARRPRGFPDVKVQLDGPCA